MDSKALSQQLAEVKTSKEFVEVMLVLQHWPQPELFQVLFAIATDYRSHPWPAYAVAADLLVSLDPRCPMTCNDVLVRLSHANLEASLQTLPFYLVTQFGKYQVLQEAEKLMTEPNLGENGRRTMGTVKYWAQRPASRLLGHYYSRWYDCEEPEEETTDER